MAWPASSARGLRPSTRSLRRKAQVGPALQPRRDHRARYGRRYPAHPRPPERQGRLESSAQEARAILSQRREVLDDVQTITAYAQDMSEFLNESELTERRAFIESFVKEIVVMPGNALMRYTIPISQSTPKPVVLLGGRSGCDWIRSGGPIGWCAT